MGASMCCEGETSCQEGEMPPLKGVEAENPLWELEGRVSGLD